MDPLEAVRALVSAAHDYSRHQDEDNYIELWSACAAVAECRMPLPLLPLIAKYALSWFLHAPDPDTDEFNLANAPQWDYLLLASLVEQRWGWAQVEELAADVFAERDPPSRRQAVVRAIRSIRKWARLPAEDISAGFAAALGADGGYDAWRDWFIATAECVPARARSSVYFGGSLIWSEKEVQREEAAALLSCCISEVRTGVYGDGEWEGAPYHKGWPDWLSEEERDAPSGEYVTVLAYGSGPTRPGWTKAWRSGCGEVGCPECSYTAQDLGDEGARDCRDSCPLCEGNGTIDGSYQAITVYRRASTIDEDDEVE